MAADVSINKGVIIGCTLHDLFYAIRQKKYLILNGEPSPKYLSEQVGPKRITHESLWVRAFWQLFASNLVFPSIPSLIEVDSKNKLLKLIDKSGKSSIAYSGSLELSSLNCVRPLDFSVSERVVNYLVEDYFRVSRGSTHPEWCVKTGQDFVESLHFYIADRIDGNKTRKDLVSVSYLSEDQLSKFEYSDTYVKFKVQQILDTHASFSSPVKIEHQLRKVHKSMEFEINNAFPKKSGPRPLRHKQALSEGVKFFESQYNKKFM